ncbi:5-oxoprolinase subunit B family protein [Leucobacter japonicus]|uniref:5-oxoprolinase subunit B family protein n=1 Tax=Leucobacter japonicus TaxID=1461259 RepID=UPI0006A79828|nr:carboxyltransferase domain-containing protein [Leucobacter japonicus]
MTQIFDAGTRGLLVELDGVAAIERVLALRGGPLVEYAVPASRSVLVVARSEQLVAALRVAIERAATGDSDLATAAPRTPRTHIIPTRYGGADLAEAAGLCGMSEAEFVRAHAESAHRVAFFGFAPGFAYIDGSDRRLELPRRSSPRKSIPAGMVAVAALQSVVYPGGTPGGWHLIGQTDFVSWNLADEPPTPFSVGDTIVFEPIGAMP